MLKTWEDSFPFFELFILTLTHEVSHKRIKTLFVECFQLNRIITLPFSKETKMFLEISCFTSKAHKRERKYCYAGAETMWFGASQLCAPKIQTPHIKRHCLSPTFNFSARCCCTKNWAAKSRGINWDVKMFSVFIKASKAPFAFQASAKRSKEYNSARDIS